MKRFFACLFLFILLLSGICLSSCSEKDKISIKEVPLEDLSGRLLASEIFRRSDIKMNEVDSYTLSMAFSIDSRINGIQLNNSVNVATMVYGQNSDNFEYMSTAEYKTVTADLKEEYSVTYGYFDGKAYSKTEGLLKDNAVYSYASKEDFLESDDDFNFVPLLVPTAGEVNISITQNGGYSVRLERFKSYMIKTLIDVLGLKNFTANSIPADMIFIYEVNSDLTVKSITIKPVYENEKPENPQFVIDIGVHAVNSTYLSGMSLDGFTEMNNYKLAKELESDFRALMKKESGSYEITTEITTVSTEFNPISEYLKISASGSYCTKPGEVSISETSTLTLLSGKSQTTVTEYKDGELRVKENESGVSVSTPYDDISALYLIESCLDPTNFSALNIDSVSDLGNGAYSVHLMPSAAIYSTARSLDLSPYNLDVNVTVYKKNDRITSCVIKVTSEEPRSSMPLPAFTMTETIIYK